LVEAMVDVWTSLGLKFVEANVHPLPKREAHSESLTTSDPRCSYVDMKRAAE